jgi:hypothetical protein
MNETINLIPLNTTRHSTTRITRILTWGEEISRGTKKAGSQLRWYGMCAYLSLFVDRSRNKKVLQEANANAMLCCAHTK